MRSLGVVVLLLLAGAALAGCLGGDDVGGDAPVRPEDAGTIVGEVREGGTLEAIADARVALVQDGKSVKQTRTATAGNFSLEWVAAGTYIVQVFAFCCGQQVQQVTVEAGTTIEVNFILNPLTNVTSTEPYEVFDLWTGSIGCMVTTVDAGPPFIPGPYFNCGQADPNNEFSHAVDVFPGVRTIVAVLTWDSGASANDLRFQVLNSVGDHPYADVTGTNPIVVRVDDAVIDEERQTFGYYTDQGVTWALKFEVRPGEIGFTYQQSFTVHYSIHYWEDAPQGFNPAPE